MLRLLKVLAIAVVLAALAIGAGLAWVWHRLHTPFPENDAELERTVTIEPGWSAGEILAALEQEGVLENAHFARLYLVRVLGDPPLQAGEYRFTGPLSVPPVLDRVIRGEVVRYPFTLIEGLTLEETAEAIASAGFGQPERLLELLRSPALIADLDPQATDLEGYLFPDTYSFPRGYAEESIVRSLVDAFRERWGERVRPLLRGAEDPRSVVTLASIVEKEAGRDDERSIIAGVYANRLRIGMGLYADPTVIYAKKQLGTWDGNLTREDLTLDSPYNTYRYPGLPPGPICSPGQRSLEAAAAPAKVPYLYFVSRNDGSHAFASTLAEHHRNVNRFQVEYWRRRWAAEGSSRGQGDEENSG